MGLMRARLASGSIGVLAAAVGALVTPGCGDGDSPGGVKDARPVSDVAPGRADAAEAPRPDATNLDPDAGTTGPDAATTGPDAGSTGADMSGTGSDADGGSASPAGLGPWTGNDNVAPSKQPPGGLRPDQVPMFVALGFDDNPDAEAVDWVVATLSALKNPPGTGKAATHDGTTPKATFYNTSAFDSAASAAAWKAAHAAGFETGNHTVNHLHGAGGPDGMNFNDAGWRTEIQGCTDFLTSPAVGARRDRDHRLPIAVRPVQRRPVPGPEGAGLLVRLQHRRGPAGRPGRHQLLLAVHPGQRQPGPRRRDRPAAHPELAQGPVGDADLRAAGPARRRGPEVRRPARPASEDRQQREDHRHGLEPVVRRRGDRARVRRRPEVHARPAPQGQPRAPADRHAQQDLRRRRQRGPARPRPPRRAPRSPTS